MSDYKFVKIKEIDFLKDYEVFYKNCKIAVLQLTIQSEFIFIRQIHVFEEYQKQGHGRNIIELLIRNSTKPIRYSISTHSQSAIRFWYRYNLKAKHIKGDTYELEKEGN